MDHKELMEEACRLGAQSASKGWGGPFGCVIAKDGEIVARGQNRVLLTGDITAHGEVTAIRKAVEVINPYAPSIPKERINEYHLELVPRPEGSPDPVPERAKMLMGHVLYTSGAPCPMCMSAIYWARIDTVYYAGDWEATQAIGFDDAFQYEDFAKPVDQRRIKLEHIHPELGEMAYEAWSSNPERHPY